MAYASIDWDTNGYDGSEISTGVHIVDGSSSGLNYEIDSATTVGSNETGINFYIDGDASEYLVSIENSFLSDWLYIENDDPESGNDNEISIRINDNYVFPYFYQNGYTDSIEFSFE